MTGQVLCGWLVGQVVGRLVSNQDGVRVVGEPFRTFDRLAAVVQ